MTGYRLIIFDWDGTLMDSVGRIVSSMQGAARDCALPVPEAAAVQEIIGLSLATAMETLFPDAGADTLGRLTERYRAHYLSLDRTPTPLFHGVEETVRQLHGAGYQLAIATGKARAGLDRVLAATGLGGYFHASRGADEARSKPDPLMLSQLLAQLDVPVERALMVGDSCLDMAMAERLGMARIGITWGVHDARRLAAHGPLHIIDRLSQLPDLLRI